MDTLAKSFSSHSLAYGNLNTNPPVDPWHSSPPKHASNTIPPILRSFSGPEINKIESVAPIHSIEPQLVAETVQKSSLKQIVVGDWKSKRDVIDV